MLKPFLNISRNRVNYNLAYRIILSLTLKQIELAEYFIQFISFEKMKINRDEDEIRSVIHFTFCYCF